MNDRIEVTKRHTVLDGMWEYKLDKVIENLQELQAQGYNKIRIERDPNAYSDDDYILNVTKIDLESDEQYNSRLAKEARDKEYRRRAFETLKQEFM
jgi:hypothetical protein